MYSVVRRIIEKVLDRVLREQLALNHNQRGFIRGMPGCKINADLIGACLSSAKRDKSHCVVAFLDISKAFDFIGHEHIKRCLQSQGVSGNLGRLIMALLHNNTIRVDNGKERSNPIHIRRSVP